MKFSKIIFPALLVLIILILCLQNYKPGTFLSGWDTLHPEFNFGLYFKRTFFGVWQEHQGLGAVAAQSHAGDLPRLLIYYPLSLFLSADFLRWSYFFICLVLGPLGVYFFLKHITHKSWVGYCGGLLYLLNLGTLQHFYLPFEMFATHFATLPWLFLFVVRFLEDGSRRNLVLFCLITLLATPASHTPTLFYVYFLALCLLLLTNIIIYKKRFVRCFLILFVTLTINSFWLLPNIYFVYNHGREVVDSKIHSQLFYRAFYTSQAFSTVPDAALIKGYLFDWGRYDSVQKGFVDLFAGWKIHLNNPLVQLTGYLVFAAVVLGIIAAFLKKKKEALVFLPLFLLSFFALATDLGFLSSVDLLREALRFHFTKFSILLMFCFSLYFGIFLEYLESRITAVILVSVVTISLIFYMLPAFKGDFISRKEKVAIPKEYFQAFNFLNEQKTGRIADFPIHTFWAWNYYDWNWEGAGFLWFGLKSPLLNREFDRWSSYNENYYWEISYAVYSKNLKLIEEVLNKYQIRWLWVDESVFDPSSPKSLYLDELEKMLSSSAKISKEKQFGKIKIYKVNIDTPVSDFVFLAKGLPSVGPIYKWNNFDQGFLENGTYISSPSSDVYYPFRSLFTGRNQEDLEFWVEEKTGSFVFKKVLPKNMENYFLEIPPLQTQDLEWVDPNDLSKIKNLSKDVFYDGKSVEVAVPKTGGLFSSNIEAGTKTMFPLPNLPHNLGYLITIDSRDLLGKPFNFWLENLNSRRADIETYLPKSKSSTSYFIQPPMEKDGLGYSMHFDQINFSNDKYKNELGKIKVYPIPFNFLTGLKLKKTGNQILPKFTAVRTDHPNSSTYFVDVPLPGGQNSTLVLSQSFDPGWQAWIYPGKFSLQRLTRHVLVNNWENGWVIEPNQKGTVIIFYWPQLLEWSGFGLMIGTFLYVGLLTKGR